MSRTLIGLLMIGLLGACGSGDTDDSTTTTSARWLTRRLRRPKPR